MLPTVALAVGGVTVSAALWGGAVWTLTPYRLEASIGAVAASLGLEIWTGAPYISSDGAGLGVLGMFGLVYP